MKESPPVGIHRDKQTLTWGPGHRAQGTAGGGGGGVEPGGLGNVGKAGVGGLKETRSSACPLCGSGNSPPDPALCVLG